MHFCQTKMFVSLFPFLRKVFEFQGPIDNKSSLVRLMAWHQAIIWTSDDQVHWNKHASLDMVPG